MISRHSAGDPGGKHVRGTNRQTHIVCQADGGHRGYFSSRPLPVSEMILADLLAHRYHDALPADHGSQTKRHRYSNLDPEGNELGGQIDMLLVIAEDLHVVRAELSLAGFLNQTNGLADDIHVVAEVASHIGRNVLEFFVKGCLVADIADQ